MTKRNLWTAWLLALIVGLPSLYLGSCVRDEMQFDSCLDRGGSWNQSTKECEAARP